MWKSKKQETLSGVSAVISCVTIKYISKLTTQLIWKVYTEEEITNNKTVYSLMKENDRFWLITLFSNHYYTLSIIKNQTKNWLNSLFYFPWKNEKIIKINKAFSAFDFRIDEDDIFNYLKLLLLFIFLIWLLLKKNIIWYWIHKSKLLFWMILKNYACLLFKF